MYYTIEETKFRLSQHRKYNHAEYFSIFSHFCINPIPLKLNLFHIKKSEFQGHDLFVLDIIASDDKHYLSSRLKINYCNGKGVKFISSIFILSFDLSPHI